MFNIGSLVSSVRRIGSLILTKAQEVAALNPVFWGDTLEAYAKSKFAVETSSSGQYLNIASQSDFGFGTDDFSVSCWVYGTSLTGDRQLWDFRSGTLNEDRIALWHSATNGLRLYLSGAYITTATTPLSINTWYLITVQKRSGIFYIYVNESLVSSIANATTLLDSPLTVGQYSGGGSGWSGYFDQFVVIKSGGTNIVPALYKSGNGVHHKDLVRTESYYPSIVAWYDFNTIQNFGRDYHGSLDLTEVSINSSNAVLGHIEGAAAGSDEVTKWTDRSASGFDVVQSIIADAATYIGNGFGSKGSFKDGELDINPEPFNFTGDFAIGCWFKQDELDQFKFPIGVWGSTGSRSFGIRNGSSGAGIQFAVSHDGSVQSNTSITDKPIVAGEWYFGFGWHENGVQIGFRMWDIRGREIGVEQLDNHTTGVFNSTSPFRVGGHTTEWNGEVGDVYVFDKLLTSDEQQKLLDYSLDSIAHEGFISELGMEVVMEQADETQISELGIEIVLEEV